MPDILKKRQKIVDSNLTHSRRYSPCQPGLSTVYRFLLNVKNPSKPRQIQLHQAFDGNSPVKTQVY
jgi:hypothetical protein